MVGQRSADRSGGSWPNEVGLIGTLAALLAVGCARNLHGASLLSGSSSDTNPEKKCVV
jgi:hypothetical protein